MAKLRSGWLVTLLCLVVVGVCAPLAHATEVDFNCFNSVQCSGSVGLSGGIYSSSGITVFNTQGPYSSATPFTLTFNTGTHAISVTDGINTLSGIIQSFSVSSGAQTTLTLHVNWTSLPASVQAFLGSTTGLNSTAISFIFSSSSGGPVSLVTLGILSTPEPASLALFGSGLVMVGGILRRRWRK